MLDIEIDDNPNCPGSGQFVYQTLAEPRPVRALRVELGGREAVCDVASVEPPGVFGPAFAQKIAESGSGVAFVVYGGKWGIRLKPPQPGGGWDLRDRSQWGEPFKIYGEEDIIYAD